MATADQIAAQIATLEGLREALIARELFVAGECFVRLRPRRPTGGLSVPLRLEATPASTRRRYMALAA